MEPIMLPMVRTHWSGFLGHEKRLYGRDGKKYAIKQVEQWTMSLLILEDNLPPITLIRKVKHIHIEYSTRPFTDAEHSPEVLGYTDTNILVEVTGDDGVVKRILCSKIEVFR